MYLIVLMALHVFGDRQGFVRPMGVDRIATVLASPVSGEVDLMYMKMVDLDPYVDYYVLAESCRDFTGKNKAYGVLTTIATDDRFFKRSRRRPSACTSIII